MNQDEIHSLGLKDSLSWGISYIDLLEDRSWEVASRKWMIEPFSQLNPWDIEKNPIGLARRMTIIKSTQAGISTMSLTKAFHFAVNWKVRIGYTLPRDQDTIDFVTTRVDPMIESSPILSDKIKQPNSVHAKRIGNSYLFFIALTTEPRMMPIDSLYVDEVDLSDQDNIATLQNRMDASRWKLNLFLSTPTLANYGIHANYQNSDMREWLVKCPSCNTEQPLAWDANLRIIGSQVNPTRVFYGCVSCNNELTVEHIQSGRWVPQKPELTSINIGYHISQMMTTPAPILYSHFRDPQTKLVEFYRKRLGMPYEIGGGSLERDDILAACFDDSYDFEQLWDGESNYYLGADQGNELQVLIFKLTKKSRRPKLVHLELIPFDKGFRRLGQLIQTYHVKKAVIDGNPNRHEVVKLIKDFPGRVLIADYIEQQKEEYKSKKGYTEDPQLRNILTNVTINRTSGFDTLMKSIKDGEYQLPGIPTALHPDIELLIDHITAIKRDIETRRTATGEIETAVWKKLRAEHLAHAWLYAQYAIKVDRGRGLRVAIIGEHTQDQETNENSNTPDKDVVKEIVSYLAEVPLKQLQDYLSAQIDTENEFVVPFPLSFKLECLVEHTPENIRWVMENILLKDA